MLQTWKKQTKEILSSAQVKARPRKMALVVLAEGP